LSASLSHLAVRILKEESKKVEVTLERLEREENLLIAQAQEEALQHPALKRKRERYASLSQVTHLLSSSLVLREVAQCTVQQAYEVIGKSEGSFLLLLEEGGEELSLAASFLAKDFSGPKLKKGDLFDQWVLKNRRPLLVRNSREDFRFNLDQLEKRDVASLMIAPLTTGQRITGLLRVESLQKDVYASDDLRLLSIIGDLVAASLENARLAQRTEELARVDELTGLYVHRYFQERLQEELSRSQRSRTPVSLLMIDIDHFKTYNDQYGHIAGDLVLKQVARLLKESARPGDLVCRYGGEEFSIILPNRTKGEAFSFAEALRIRVEKESFTLRREMTHVTISIGVASFPEECLLKDELLKRVDSFLYQAKREGRNRVCGS